MRAVLSASACRYALQQAEADLERELAGASGLQREAAEAGAWPQALLSQAGGDSRPVDTARLERALTTARTMDYPHATQLAACEELLGVARARQEAALAAAAACAAAAPIDVTDLAAKLEEAAALGMSARDDARLEAFSAKLAAARQAQSAALARVQKAAGAAATALDCDALRAHLDAAAVEGVPEAALTPYARKGEQARVAQVTGAVDAAARERPLDCDALHRCLEAAKALDAPRLRLQTHEATLARARAEQASASPGLPWPPLLTLFLASPAPPLSPSL